jgi:hypothetical protein
MNKEDIIRMAREAGLAFDSEEFPEIWQTYMYVGREEIERFAELVASAEREEIAQFIERTELGSLPDETALQYARLLKSYSSSIRARGQA